MKVKVDIPPLAKEELESRLTIMGRGKKNPLLAKEILKQLRSEGRMELSPEAVTFVYEELLDAEKIMKSPGMASDPYFQYQLVGVQKALSNLRKLTASTEPESLLATVRAAVSAARAGLPFDKAEVVSMISATTTYLSAADGKCPDEGCVLKKNGKWRVVSNKTGELWPQTYDSEQDAKDAIAAYHIARSK